MYFFIFGGVVAFNVIGFLKKHFLFIKCSCERQQHCIGVSHSFPYSLCQQNLYILMHIRYYIENVLLYIYSDRTLQN